MNETHKLEARLHDIRPYAEIEKNATEVRVYLEMPGINKNNVVLETNSDSLVISAELEGHEALWRPVYQEKRGGRYFCKFQLHPSLDAEGCIAKMEDGVLQLTIPIKSEYQAKKILIN